MTSPPACARCGREVIPDESAPPGEALCAPCLEAVRAAAAVPRGSRGQVIGVGVFLTLLGLFWVGAAFTLTGRFYFFPVVLLASGVFALTRGLRMPR